MKPKHRFKVGDVVEAQGARLKVLECFIHGNKPAYKMRSPFTKGESWRVDEWVLESCKKVRERKGEFK